MSAGDVLGIFLLVLLIGFRLAFFKEMGVCILPGLRAKALVASGSLANFWQIWDCMARSPLLYCP